MTPLDQCRRRTQQELHGHRGRAQDPLYRARRTLHTGADLLTPRQQARLDALFTGDDHVQLEATYGVYQQLVAAYRDPDRANGRARMEALIASISSAVPGALREVTALGRTLKKRATDVLAYFDRPGTSNGPTEALNGRLEHLRGSALGSGTSPTTSPDHCSRPADSDPNYTLHCDEPFIRSLIEYPTILFECTSLIAHR